MTDLQLLSVGSDVCCCGRCAWNRRRGAWELSVRSEVTTLLAAVGVAAMLGVLLPVISAHGAGMRWELDAVREDLETPRPELRTEVAELRREGRADIAKLCSDLHALTERVARIEGVLSGPWRSPTNGTPAPSPPPEEKA